MSRLPEKPEQDVKPQKYMPEQPEQPVTPSREVPNLFHLTVRGGLWVFALRIALQVLSFGRWILLANLLGLKDWGVFGLAALLMDVLGTFSTTGFEQALIQKKSDILQYLDSVWTIGIIRAAILFSLLWIAAPWVVHLRFDPDRAQVAMSAVRLLGVSLFLSALRNPGTLFFRKELQFHKTFLLQIFSTAISIAVTVTLALLYRNVWSLVLGRLSASLFHCVLSYWLHPYRPRLAFNRSQVGELWRFGRWIALMKIVSFVLTKGDDLFVLSYLGVESFALYQMAYRLSNLPATEITSMISQVTFSAYSKIQDDLPRLCEAYEKTLTVNVFVSAGLAGLILAFSPHFVRLFLHERWAGSVGALQVLAVFGLLRSIGSTRAPLLTALGKVRIISMLQVAKLVVFVILLYPLTSRYGLIGTALTITTVSLCGQLFGGYILVRALTIQARRVLIPVFVPLAGIAAILGVLWLTEKFFFSEVGDSAFAVLFVLAVIAYCVTTGLIGRFTGLHYFKHIRQVASTCISNSADHK